MKYTSTAYSLAILYKDVIYAVRDPLGNRPLAIGKLAVSASSRRGSAGKHAVCQTHILDKLYNLLLDNEWGI